MRCCASTRRASTAPTWEEFDTRRLPEHRLVAVDAGVVVGWVSVSPFSSRPFYAGVVEHSVYVDPTAAGRGVGTALLHALIASTEAAGIWTIHSRIFPENSASLALHAKSGFVVTGVWHRLPVTRLVPVATAVGLSMQGVRTVVLVEAVA